MTYTCYQCNLNCQKDRSQIVDMDLDPDSDNNYDRMIYCPNWSDFAMFEKDGEDNEDEEEYE